MKVSTKSLLNAKRFHTMLKAHESLRVWLWDLDVSAWSAYGSFSEAVSAARVMHVTLTRSRFRRVRCFQAIECFKLNLAAVRQTAVTLFVHVGASLQTFLT